MLIRAAYDPETGILYDGPGKLCRYLGITRADDGRDACSDPGFSVEETGLSPAYVATPRIGIRLAADRPWRFVATDVAELARIIP